MRRIGLFALALSLVVPAGMAPAAAPPAPRIDALSIPGTPAFTAIAKDVLKTESAIWPDFASGNGLIDDARSVPSYTPEALATLHGRLQTDLARLRAMPWRRWSVDRQIDFRWTYAVAETLDRHLMVERMYLHRPGEWLETTANNLVAILTWAPDRLDVLGEVTGRIPAMVAEMQRICVRPTNRDVAISADLCEGLIALLKANPAIAHRDEAIAALTSYWNHVTSLSGLSEFEVIGSTNYAWRLRHAELLDWTPDQLLAKAQAELAKVEADLASLTPKMGSKPTLDEAQERLAHTLDQRSLLELYDHIQIENRTAIEKAGFVTIPSGVGPIHARVTPDPVVPLTGDGGSMNPPPPMLPSNVGWWNVEHFNASDSVSAREDVVRESVDFKLNGMGPYAAHEGLPGHHLQLSIARLNPDPLRSLLSDSVQNEGWALYAEQLFWEQGGLGDSVAAHINTLRSWQHRIRRVIYDVNVETGRWTLQQAADWKHHAKPGTGEIDPDLLRSINWPTQLIAYFSGKEQILAMKTACRKKWGKGFSERRFNDELLAVGSVPFAFARAKLLGEPVPGI
jgi:hypothetical protein